MFFSFNKYKKIQLLVFLVLANGCWLSPEKFGICPKNNGFTQLRGAAATPAPLRLVRLWEWLPCNNHIAYVNYPEQGDKLASK